MQRIQPFDFRGRTHAIGHLPVTEWLTLGGTADHTEGRCRHSRCTPNGVRRRPHWGHRAIRRQATPAGLQANRSITNATQLYKTTLAQQRGASFIVHTEAGTDAVGNVARMLREPLKIARRGPLASSYSGMVPMFFFRSACMRGRPAAEVSIPKPNR